MWICAKGAYRTFGGSRNLDRGGHYGMYTFVKTCQSVYFKCVQFTVHKLYINNTVFKSGMNKMEIKQCQHSISHRNTVLSHH